MKNRILYTILIFITPLLIIMLPGNGEDNLIINIEGYPLFYTELFYIIPVIICLFKAKIILNFSSILMILGILISFFSCMYNYENDIILYTIISIDFYLYGLIFNFISIKDLNLKIVKWLLLICFFYISLQTLLIPTGIIKVSAGQYGQEYDLVRYGTTFGGPSSSGFILFFLMGLLFFLIDNRKMQFIIYVTGFISILFTLSRGPIFSIILSSIVYFLYEFRKSKYSLIIIVLVFTVIYGIESKYNLISVIKRRTEKTDFTSGRDERLEYSYHLFEKSSFLLGAGPLSVPLERKTNSDHEFNDRDSASPHNVYMSYLVGNGFLGLMIHIILIFYVYKRVLKTNKKVTFPLIVFVSLPIIMMNTELTLRNYYFSFFFWFYYLLLLNKNSIIYDSTFKNFQILK